MKRLIFIALLFIQNALANDIDNAKKIALDKVNALNDALHCGTLDDTAKSFLFVDNTKPGVDLRAFLVVSSVLPECKDKSQTAAKYRVAEVVQVNDKFRVSNDDVFAEMKPSDLKINPEEIVKVELKQPTVVTFTTKENDEFFEFKIFFKPQPDGSNKFVKFEGGKIKVEQK